MIRPITQYPTQTGFDFDGVVRSFDKELESLVEDLKDTIHANNLEGLSAFQIGSPKAVIVIKDHENFLVMINPVIFTKEGEITTQERTAYYPNLTASITRAHTIKVTYDDLQGKQHFLTATDHLAIVIQRKSDYLLGSTFITRLSKEEREKFQYQLKSTYGNGSQSCLLSPFSDRVIKGINITLILTLLGLLVGLLGIGNLPIVSIQEALMIATASLIGLYLLLRIYEGKKCGICEIGNTLAMVVIKSIHLGGVYLLNYWILF
jgi:peptide deformylase